MTPVVYTIVSVGHRKMIRVRSSQLRDGILLLPPVRPGYPERPALPERGSCLGFSGRAQCGMDICKYLYPCIELYITA